MDIYTLLAVGLFFLGLIVGYAIGYFSRVTDDMHRCSARIERAILWPRETHTWRSPSSESRYFKNRPIKKRT